MKEQAKVLSEANELTRLMIRHYMQKHELSLNAFSKATLRTGNVSPVNTFSSTMHSPWMMTTSQVII